MRQLTVISRYFAMKDFELSLLPRWYYHRNEVVLQNREDLPKGDLGNSACRFLIWKSSLGSY